VLPMRCISTIVGPVKMLVKSKASRDQAVVADFVSQGALSQEISQRNWGGVAHFGHIR
jgi:hypothetical protein